MGTRISTQISVVVAVIAAVLAVLYTPAAVASDDTTYLYFLPTSSSGPEEIAAGPDGNMWFTESSGKIGRITPAGVITEYPVPTAAGSPRGIAAGPDGNMWFTEGWGPPGCSPSQIGRITLDGTITEYPLPWTSDEQKSSTTLGSCPRGIAAGPDGNLWFAEYAGSAIGRITPAGVITEYPLPTFGSPEGIAAGPDGNLWFTEGYGNKIGRITLDGTITEYPLPTYGGRPHGIAAGPDGNMWFTERGDPNFSWTGNRIGRITTAGVITEYRLPTKGSSPSGIAAGPDGNMWFTTMSGGIGRITPGGAIVEYFVDTAFTSGIAAGPDGYMWFTAQDAIGRISPNATVVKKTCPVNVTLHKPTPKTVGNRILTDKITTNTSTCVLPKPVVLCRPLGSTAAGEKAFCNTKVTTRGMIRVNTLGYESVRVTVLARAKPKPGQKQSWKPATWRSAWILSEPAAATNKGETHLTLSKRLVRSMDAADVSIKAIRGATLSKSGVVTFHVRSVKGDVITHKGGLRFSSSAGFVTLQNIALNYKTGKATALVEATAVPTGMQIADLLTFTGGTNQIKRNGTWRNAEVALATSTSVGNPATLFASQLGLPTGSIATGMTIGKARVTLQFS